MKIGILTFVHTSNFGANLQCFALFKTLKDLGKDVEVIDLYRPVDKGYIACREDSERFPALFRYRSYKDYRSKFNKFIARCIRLFVKKRNNKGKVGKNGFERFHEEYIKLSSLEYRSLNQLYNNYVQGQYTHLIVGSDQVWNYASEFSKEPFFLTFDNKAKKISYAASIGHSSIPAKVAEKYREWLKDFSAISVREDSAVNLISELTEKKVDFVLDPTLLLNKQQWLESLHIKHSEDKEFVLVYMLSVSTTAINLATLIASRLGCGVKIITHRPYYKNIENCEFLRSENPLSFVEKYSKAKFVVTNSFHGTAFAINFNIPFVTVAKEQDRLNSRKSSLLSLLHLKGREVCENDSYDIDGLMNMNFTEANKILEEERKRSLDFLLGSL